jgi:cytochrome c biogenesis protein CcdA
MSGFNDSGENAVGFDPQLKKPSASMFFLGLFSVVAGTCVGVFGLIAAKTDSSQSLVGVLGYLLTAIFPIVLLQIIRNRHSKAVQKNEEEAYDIYSGMLNEARFKKIVFLGLVSAALSIWVFLQPIAESFA